MSSLTLLFLLIPAVSTRLKSNPKRLYLVSILSLVVPAISVTIYLSLPIKAFINEDLPALGLPTTANRGRFSSTSFSSGKCFTNSSNNSPVPLPLTLDIEKNSLNPSE